MKLLTGIEQWLLTRCLLYLSYLLLSFAHLWVFRLTDLTFLFVTWIWITDFSLLFAFCCRTCSFQEKGTLIWKTMYSFSFPCSSTDVALTWTKAPGPLWSRVLGQIFQARNNCVQVLQARLCSCALSQCYNLLHDRDWWGLLGSQPGKAICRSPNILPSHTECMINLDQPTWYPFHSYQGLLLICIHHYIMNTNQATNMENGRCARRTWSICVWQYIQASMLTCITEVMIQVTIPEVQRYHSYEEPNEMLFWGAQFGSLFPCLTWFL